jgi:hypothetical protein
MQVIYRGQTFSVKTVPTAALIKATRPQTQTLLYRGHSYHFNQAEQTTSLPRMINWRYSVPCQAAGGWLNPVGCQHQLL